MLRLFEARLSCSVLVLFYVGSMLGFSMYANGKNRLNEQVAQVALDIKL